MGQLNSQSTSYDIEGQTSAIKYSNQIFLSSNQQVIYLWNTNLLVRQMVFFWFSVISEKVASLQINVLLTPNICNINTKSIWHWLEINVILIPNKCDIYSKRWPRSQFPHEEFTAIAESWMQMNTALVSDSIWQLYRKRSGVTSQLQFTMLRGCKVTLVAFIGLLSTERPLSLAFFPRFAESLLREILAPPPGSLTGLWGKPPSILGHILLLLPTCWKGCSPIGTCFLTRRRWKLSLL